jgi:aspartate ammonia-lyase
MFRIEKDALGQKKIPSDAMYGIHALRAKENFPGNIPFPIEWYKAVGLTKLSCYTTYRKFRDAASAKYDKKLTIKLIGDEILDPLTEAAREVSEGRYFEYFIVPAVQGGAGTSINMNINEILANAALRKAGNDFGNYTIIDPIEHANIYQSTNDVIPTSLTVAAMFALQELESQIDKLRKKTESLEREAGNKLRTGFTQLQEAVPSSFGILFSTYSGGGAIGTGLAVPRFFIMHVIQELRNLTGLPLAHGENLVDSTSNLDKWVEVHAILKASAVNLEKMVSDLRLLSSDITGERLVTIPARQTGSSIMPGKINPVIPEYVISSSHKVYSNDILVSSLAGQGCLELNAYLPVIGYAVLESINLLTLSCKSTGENMIDEMTINESAGYNSLIRSPSLTTALVPHTGYHKAASLANLMKEKKIDIFEANEILKIIPGQKLKEILQPGNLLKAGFSLEDLK